MESVNATAVLIAAGIASTPAPATILADYRRGVGRIRTAPDKFLGCAAGIKLTAHEAWTIGWAIQHEFGGVLGTTSPADHLGRVWEEADRLEREGREVTVLTVWAAVQSKIRTRDVRDMANALDVPRLRKNRKTAAETAKLAAMRPLRFGSADDGWTPGSLLEEHLEVDEAPFPAPDKAFTAWERYFYSEDDAHELLVRILQDTKGAHPGAALLLQVMDYRIEQGRAQTKNCGHRVLEVLALELARLQKPGAWARAVNRAAKQLACRDDDVRDAVATTLYTITLRSGNTHRETVRRVLDIDELLRRNGARGPYNKKSRTPA